MLLNPCGDFNMVYYDDREEIRGFYKFNNIQIDHACSKVEYGYVPAIYISDLNASFKNCFCRACHIDIA